MTRPLSTIFLLILYALAATAAYGQATQPIYFDRVEVAFRDGTQYSTTQPAWRVITHKSDGTEAIGLLEAPSSPVVNLDAADLTTGTVPLSAGTVYTLTKTKTIAAPLAKVGNGPNPIIRYTGPRDTGALGVPWGKSASADNIDFQVAPWTYAVSSAGAFSSTNCTVKGGGGAIRLVGASGNNKLVNWTVLDNAEGYVFYVGPLATETKDPPSYKQRPSAGIELVNCTALKGSRLMHVLRVHNCDSVVVKGCHFADPDKIGAVGRIHDGGNVILADDNFQGDFNLAPMGEGDGGINMPPGPKRDFFNAMRLKSVTATNCTFDTGIFKVNSGLLSGTFSKCTIKASVGGALIQTPFPYLDRPRSQATFAGCTLLYTGSSGRVFGSVDGSRAMLLMNSMFQGRAVGAHGEAN